MRATQLIEQNYFYIFKHLKNDGEKLFLNIFIYIIIFLLKIEFYLYSLTFRIFFFFLM